MLPKPLWFTRVCHDRHECVLFRKEILHTKVFPVGRSISFTSVWQLQWTSSFLEGCLFSPFLHESRITVSPTPASKCNNPKHSCVCSKSQLCSASHSCVSKKRCASQNETSHSLLGEKPPQTSKTSHRTIRPGPWPLLPAPEPRAEVGFAGGGESLCLGISPSPHTPVSPSRLPLLSRPGVFRQGPGRTPLPLAPVSRSWRGAEPPWDSRHPRGTP